MNEKTGEFIPKDSSAYRQENARRAQAGPGNRAAMPILEEGEKVLIKGVEFRVKKIKMFSGHLALQMVPKG